MASCALATVTIDRPSPDLAPLPGKGKKPWREKLLVGWREFRPPKIYSGYFQSERAAATEKEERLVSGP